MGFLTSFRKNARVLKISRVLGKDQDGAAFVAMLESKAPNPRERAERALFDLCESDPECRAVMAKYGADRAVLESLFHELRAYGAGQWAGAHYVPVSALAWAKPLEFLLANIESRPGPDLAVDIIQMIRRGRFE